jgi:peptidoglycan/LPS O-acetylase OafA/YrhL
VANSNESSAGANSNLVNGPVSYKPDLGGHVPALDAIRGLAILLVTIFRFHSDPEQFADPVVTSTVGKAFFALLKEGYRGVDLFFVLSGFLITGILFDAKQGPHYFRNFYIRRVLRIFPLYYGALLLGLIVLPALFPLFRELYSTSIREQGWLWLFGTNIYLSIVNTWSLPGFEHFWSLAVEEHYYLVWPLLLFFCSRRSAMAVCVACIIAATLVRVGVLWRPISPEQFSAVADLVTTGVQTQAATTWGLVLHVVRFPTVGGGPLAPAAETLTPCRLDALAIGSFLALAARGPGGVRRGLLPCLGACVVGMVIMAALAFASPRFGPQALRWGLLFSVDSFFFAGLIIIAVLTPPTSWGAWFSNNSVLQFFGKYSFGWYVFQGALVLPLAVLFTPSKLAGWIGSPVLARLIFILWGGSISLGMAIVSWHLFEKHFLRLKDLFASKPKPAPTPEVQSRVLETSS